MKKWFQDKFKSFFANGKNLDGACGLIAFASFLVILLVFLPQNFIESNQSVLGLFILPAIFWGCIVQTAEAKEAFFKVGLVVPETLRMISFSGWLGMIVVGIVTLNEWYKDPKNGQLEPYFIATTLCAAAYFAALRKFNEYRKIRPKRSW